jgi:hypothetical protein
MPYNIRSDLTKMAATVYDKAKEMHDEREEA